MKIILDLMAMYSKSKSRTLFRIAKKPHTVLVDGVSEEQKRYLISKFRQECLLLSKLKHPNIVEFVGVYYGSGGEDG